MLGVRTTWEKKMKQKSDRQYVQKLEKEMVEEGERKRREKKEARRMRQQQQQEKRDQAMIAAQKAVDPRKLKKMTRKQLQSMKKRV